MKLKSGKEVELRDVTFAEREEVQNLVTVGQSAEGMITMQNTVKARNMWVRFGLKTPDVDGERAYVLDKVMNALSDEELNEISIAVREKTELGDNEKKA